MQVSDTVDSFSTNEALMEVVMEVVWILLLRLGLGFVFEGEFVVLPTSIFNV